MDDNDRRQVDTDYDNISPRLGFAWNVTPKTSVRSGYGIFYMPSHVQAAGHSGSAGMMGFNTQSNMIVSLDGRTPFRTIDNPFPDGFNLPPGDTEGASTNLGLGIGGGTGGVFTTNEAPYMQQWNVNVQRELPGNIITEVAYIGSHGTNLLIGESGLVFSQVDPSYFSLGTALQDQVPNPFFGIITNPSSPLRFATVSRNRLLRPYPQYDGVTRLPGAGRDVDLSRRHGARGQALRQRPQPAHLLHAGRADRRCVHDRRISSGRPAPSRTPTIAPVIDRPRATT